MTPSSTDDEFQRVLIIGSGLVASYLQEHLVRAGLSVRMVSRSRSSPGQSDVDLSSRAAPRLLASTVETADPDVIVLAHGPTRIEECEQDPRLARLVHERTAGVIRDTERRTLLVSSDAVFDGSRDRHGIDDCRHPRSAYGRAKVAAEDALAGVGTARIVRLALVYGWSPGAGAGANFVERCLRTVARGEPFEAPVDQFVTPIYAPDAAEALGAVGTTASAEPIVHVACADRCSRFEIAHAAVRAAGHDVELVRPVERPGTTWESRPRSSGLAPTVELPGLPGWQPRSIVAGLHAMTTEGPAGSVR